MNYVLTCKLTNHRIKLQKLLKSQFFLQRISNFFQIEFQISLKYCAKSSTKLLEILTPFQTDIYIYI